MSAASLAPGLVRKVKKILDIRTEDQDLIGSVSTLSTFYDDNTGPERRSLRSTIEKRGLEINNQFLQAAESVFKVLDAVQQHLDGLSSCCSAMVGALSETKASTSALLADSERLQKELSAVERRSSAVQLFLEQYQLAPEEVEALQRGELTPLFFSALARVRTIHDNCKALLRTHHQRAGLELMDLMAAHQEGAYERLCRWVQAECRGIGDYDAPEVEPLLQTAVAALRERPVLFKYCAEEVATVRHNALFQRFITALTRGGPGGLPRPIELHAHDPQRYVSDMLAWVHQALASEREFITALFGDEALTQQAAHQPLSPSATGFSAAGDSLHGASSEALSCALLLDRIFESICRPMKVRIEQVLMMGPPPLLLCYQLSQLLAFYLRLVCDMLGPAAQLSGALRGCHDMAQRTFFEQLKARGEKLLRTPPQPPYDLSPPQQVGETLHMLSEILAAHELALGVDEAEGEGGAAAEALNAVLAAALDPLVEMCERSAEAISTDSPARLDEVSNLDPTAYRVYLINCLAAMHATLAARGSARQRAKFISDQVEVQVSALVGGEVGRLLSRCGLAEIADRIRLYQMQAGGREVGALASDPALSIHHIQEAMRAFFVLLSSPETLNEFPRLQLPKLRSEAVLRVGRSLVSTYELVYAALEDPASGYLASGGAAGVRHSPAQVRTILGVL